jgi:hypothetical protein
MRSPLAIYYNPQTHAVLLAIVMLQALSWLDGANSQTLVLRDWYALTPTFVVCSRLMRPQRRLQNLSYDPPANPRSCPGPSLANASMYTSLQVMAANIKYDVDMDW